jgi:hypothetical protein
MQLEGPASLWVSWALSGPERDARGRYRNRPQRPRAGAAGSADLPQRAATVLLTLFLVAVLAVLAVTLYSATSPVGLFAATVVSLIVGLALIFLYFERLRRPWSSAGAAALGLLGVTLGLILNSHPQLEVGGGLPAWVPLAYVTLGTLVIVTSLWAFLGPGWALVRPLEVTLHPRSNSHRRGGLHPRATTGCHEPRDRLPITTARGPLR